MQQRSGAEYWRKSQEDKDRQVASIPRQKQSTARLKKLYDIPIVFTAEESKSAKIPHNRPKFDELLNLVESGAVYYILCWKANRLCRNALEAGKIIQLVNEGKLEIYTEHGNFNKENAIMLTIEFGFSTKYSIDLSNDIKDGLEKKVSDGIYPAKAKLGYLNTPTKQQGTRNIVEDPNSFDLCKQWWSIMASGTVTVDESLRQITALGLRRNGKPITRSSAYRFFRDEFYTGHFKWHDQLHVGKHTQMVSMSDFLKVQNFLTDKGKKGKGETQLPFQGFIRCSCTATVTAEKHTKKYKNGTSQTFYYYRCTKKKGECNERYMNAKIIEEQIRAYIDDLTLHPRYVALVRKILKRETANRFGSIAKLRELQTKELEKIDKKLEVLYERKVDGAIDPERFKKQKNTLILQQKRVKEQTFDNHEYWDQVIDRTLDFAETMRETFESGDSFKKQMVLKILGSNLIIRGQKLELEAKNAFIMLRDAQKAILSNQTWIEPKKGLSEQDKEILLLQQSQNVLVVGLEPTRPKVIGF